MSLQLAESFHMADFTRHIAPEILAACERGGEDAAGAFSRAFDGPFSCAAGNVSTISRNSIPDTWNGPGLVIALHVGSSGALLLLPESSGLVPGWCAEPDDAGRGKLVTLAQELGCAILPSGFAPDKTSAARVKDLAYAFRRAEPAGDVGYLPLTLTGGNRSGEAALVWPLPAVANSLEELDVEQTQSSSTEAALATVTNPSPAQTEFAAPAAQDAPPRSRLQYADLDDGIRQLPNYAKSLLKVRVPVTVTLASAKYPVSQILELGPGSIIQFNKSCEDNLTLEVGNQPIASGEAVKVGDKFGLWITAMTMPDERFWVIHGRRNGARVK